MVVKNLDTADLEGMLETSEVAALLRFSVFYVHRLVQRGKLAATRIGPKQGGVLLFKREDVEEFDRTHKRYKRREATNGIG